MKRKNKEYDITDFIYEISNDFLQGDELKYFKQQIDQNKILSKRLVLASYCFKISNIFIIVTIGFYFDKNNGKHLTMYKNYNSIFLNVRPLDTPITFNSQSPNRNGRVYSNNYSRKVPTQNSGSYTKKVIGRGTTKAVQYWSGDATALYSYEYAYGKIFQLSPEYWIYFNKSSNKISLFCDGVLNRLKKEYKEAIMNYII